jgi:ABC-type phosphate transport system substrate-binding protein
MLKRFKVAIIIFSFAFSALAYIPKPDPLTTPPVVDDPLVIIVNKSNPIDNLSFSDLRKTFMAESRSWSNGRRITIVMREPGQPERTAMLRQIYRMSESEFNKYFLQAAFNGTAQGPPKSLASVDGMRKFVFNVPSAIGYIRSSEIDSSVKVIRIDGLSFDAPGYKLKNSK